MKKIFFAYTILMLMYCSSIPVNTPTDDKAYNILFGTKRVKLATLKKIYKSKDPKPIFEAINRVINTPPNKIYAYNSKLFTILTINYLAKFARYDKSIIKKGWEYLIKLFDFYIKRKDNNGINGFVRFFDKIMDREAFYNIAKKLKNLPEGNNKNLSIAIKKLARYDTMKESKEFISLLKSLTNKKDQNILLALIYAIGNLNIKELKGLLKDKTNNKNKKIRVEAKLALAKMGDKSMVKSLLDEFRYDDKNRVKYIRTLERLGLGYGSIMRNYEYSIIDEKYKYDKNELASKIKKWKEKYK